MKRDSKGRFVKGHNTPVPLSVRKKISRTCKKNGVGLWMFGRKPTKETLKKLSENNPRYWLGKTGPANVNWKGGKDRKISLLPSVRALDAYIKWRDFIFRRDNYTCVLCKRKKEVSGRLEADHYPKQFVDIFNEYQIKTEEEALKCTELWDTNNGRTLCRECHNPTRGKGRYKIFS